VQDNQLKPKKGLCITLKCSGNPEDRVC